MISYYFLKYFLVGSLTDLQYLKMFQKQIYKDATDLRKQELLLACNIDLYSGVQDESSALISFN